MKNIFGLVLTSVLFFIACETGFFASPWGDDPDLEIEAGEQLATFLGGTVAFPSASINRKSFDGSDLILVGEDKWTSAFENELPLASPVNIDFEFSLNNDFEGNIKVDMHYTEDVSGVNKFTVLLLENDVIATQDDDGEIIDDYKHKHVLRRVYTKFDGNILKSNPKAGDTFEALIPFIDLDEAWDLNNVEIVAFVHKSGSDKSVLHVGHKKLID